MSALPSLSIIVPTCGRPGAMRRLLRALAHQQEAPPFEVVVVADGVPAPASGVGDPRAWPFRVHVIEQARSGAAAARNAGAAAARGGLLLFLDDDVEPGLMVVAEHVRFHSGRPTLIGTGELRPHSIRGGTIGSALCGWWETMGDALADPRHRFTFRDVLTGHCSVSRQTFEMLGGFDTSLRCHEDFEFGYRAIESGVDIRHVSAARAVHHDDSDLDKICARKFEEGIASVQLIARHPALLRALPVGRALAQARFADAVYRVAIRSSGTAAIVESGLRVAMRVFDALSMRDKWRASLERLMDVAYWRGVRVGAGGAEAVREIRMRQDVEERPGLTIDLRDGLERAEEQIELHRPWALRVLIGEHLAGEVADQPGAERLRGVHLRPLLLKNFGRELAIAALRAGLLPEVLHGAVGVSEVTAAHTDVGAGQAA